MKAFERLLLWVDDQPRSGPENMAVDEWLLEKSTIPVLRVYDWSGGWGSIGYFGKLDEAKRLLTELKIVRRWTGGGLVDHRGGWTYTVFAPSGERLALLRGAESYHIIHTALLDALRIESVPASSSMGAEETGATSCFENPVSYDLIDADGQKLAGAGQRRTRRGLLHQGAVAPCGFPNNRATALACALAEKWEYFTPTLNDAEIAHKITTRYGSEAWLEKR